MLVGSVVTKTYRNSILNTPTQQTLAETKVYHQSKVILLRSNVRETLVVSLMMTPALLLKVLDLTVPNALLLLSSSSLQRVQNHASDWVILYSSRVDVAGECLSYHSVAVGINISSSAPPTTLSFLVYAIRLGCHGRKWSQLCWV